MYFLGKIYTIMYKFEAKYLLVNIYVTNWTITCAVPKNFTE